MVEQVVGLKFVVEGEREAKRALKEVSDNQSKLTRDILRGADQVKSLSREWDKANRYLQEGTINSKAHAQAQIRLAREYALLNGYIKSNGALNTQRALAEMHAAQATRDAAADAERTARATKRLADRNLELRMRFQEGYAQFARQREAMRSLREAYRNGIITLQQYQAQLARIRTINQGNVAGTNNLGVAMQQTGYQVGDFMVQIQSGTNAFVAFGQQATQLVGVLYLLPPATLAAKVGILGLQVSVSALVMTLGIAIPVLTAIGAAIVRARGNAKNFEDSLTKLGDVVSGLKDTQSLLAMSAEDLTEKYGEAAGAVREYAEIEAQLRVSLARSEISKSIVGLSKLTTAYGRTGHAVRSMLQNTSAIEKDFDVSGDVARKLMVHFQDLQRATNFDEQKVAVDGLIGSMQELDISLADVPSDVAQMLVNFIKANRSVEEANALIKLLNGGIVQANDNTKKLSNSQKLYNDLLKSGRDADFERRRDSRRAVIDMRAQLALQSKINTFGEESVEVARYRAEQEAISKNLTTDAAKEYVELAVQIHKATVETKKQLELEKEISEAAAERNKEFADRKISLENEIRILRLTLRYGEDSVQVQKELNLQARARLITEMMADGQSADRIVAMLKLLKTHQELTAEVDKMKDSTDDLLDIVEQITGVDLKKAFYDAATSVSTMNSRLDLTMTKIQGILGAIGSIGFETVATEAQTRALREGKSVAQSRIEGQIAQRRAELEQSGEIGPLAGAALTAYRKTLEADMRAQEELQRELSDPRRKAPPRRPFDIEYPEPDKEGGGAGGDIFLSMFPELQRAYEQAQKDAQAYNEEVQILDSALKAGKISQQEYNSYLSQAQEVYGQASTAALQYENALLQMANTTSQAMSDAMMSIVDGTKSAKDAFSDMARIIIKKAFEMAVINPILNAIFGGVTGYVAAPSFFGAPAAAAAKGMTFQGGNVVPFANGGVVGGPATFPMSGGRTGLMGEAGPEAIMPLKRGKDGKLGVQATGASVNQTLVFNISANGDESVKRIVQQQIPNIAQATKAAVVDAKRRGGSYGRAMA